MEGYTRDVGKPEDYLCRRSREGLDEENVLGYKQYLGEYYKTASVNSMLTAVNGFLEYIDRGECEVKLLKIQRVQFSDKEKGLTKKGYAGPVHTAERKGGVRMSMLPQAIGNTGVRINELLFITVESLEIGRTDICSKGKPRIILLPTELVKILKSYYRKVGIWSGSISITRNGKLVDRSNISKRMKLSGREVGVDTPKVFPHNFRHLFARTSYSVEKDMVRLMNLLGHSSINTTRTYTISTEEQPRRWTSRVQLVLG